jgi:uncharacterized protein
LTSVVADTSALLALAACDALELLDKLFGEVVVPAAVHNECAIPGMAHSDRLTNYLRRVQDIDLSEFIIAAPGLGRGELEAMALFKRRRADYLLIDDQRARRVARLNGINVIGSLGVLLKAKTAGHIDSVRVAIEKMQSSGIHLSEELISESLRLANE